MMPSLSDNKSTSLPCPSPPYEQREDARTRQNEKERDRETERQSDRVRDKERERETDRKGRRHRPLCVPTELGVGLTFTGIGFLFFGPLFIHCCPCPLLSTCSPSACPLSILLFHLRSLCCSLSFSLLLSLAVTSASPHLSLRSCTDATPLRRRHLILR